MKKTPNKSDKYSGALILHINGTQNGDKKRAGRKPKYNYQYVKKELDWMFNFLISDPQGQQVLFLKELVLCRRAILGNKGYSTQRYSEWKSKFTGADSKLTGKQKRRLLDSINTIDEILEMRVARGGLTGKINFVMAMFCLKNNYDWKDKAENNINMVPPININYNAPKDQING